MHLLLLGGTGQVGEAFRALSFPPDVNVFAPSRAEVDLCDAAALARMVAAQPWGAVINAAAYTEVDRAETESALAHAINAEAPARLAAETGRLGIPLVHISTDYVFDGRKGEPYVENDAMAPLSVYGRSKLAGEHGVVANPRHVILRTAWVYSPVRKNFVRTILRLAAERDRLSIVADQHGCPTAASDIAQACRDIVLRCATDREHAPYGTYHFAGGGDATWFEFAQAIVALATGRLGRRPEVVPISTADYPTTATRPADTRLDCTAMLRAFGAAPRPWRQVLAETIDTILARKDVA